MGSKTTSGSSARTNNLRRTDLFIGSQFPRQTFSVDGFALNIQPPRSLGPVATTRREGFKDMTPFNHD
jgi:polyisoprenoid-binding protein YceI